MSLNPRVTAALERRAALARAGQPPGTPLEGLVFCQPDDCPLRPQGVLTELRHSTLSTTVNPYGHLLPHAARRNGA
ncbi:hypothetical protein [Streptomyces sp. 4N124]|uniref:hypothetical protein n=1 Tax=Streptomyces sp. 4N124 TaxID=3457420 RepID=UPI003FD41717